MVNGDITATSVSLHAATSGTGTLTFDAGVDVDANSQTYQAGLLNGTGTTASVNLVTGAPLFSDEAGNAAPMNFTYEQDATISSFPAPGQFGGSIDGMPYMIQAYGNGSAIVINTGSGADLAGSALTLNASGAGGTVIINDTLGGANSLDSLSLTATGATIGGGAVSTAGDQNYNNTPVILTAPTTLTSSTLELGSVVGGNNSLTLANTGLATLNGAISGVNLLTADGSGGTLLTKSTIAAANLADSEGTTLSGGSVTTTGGDQDYTGTVTLGADTTLNSGTVELSAVNGGNNNLTLNNTGLATLNGAVQVEVQFRQGQRRRHQRLGEGGEVEPGHRHGGSRHQARISRLARLSATETWTRCATSMAEKASCQVTTSSPRPRQAW